MKINAVAERLVELLKDKQFIQAQKELFDSNVISMEPPSHPEPRTEGIKNLLSKEKNFIASINEWHAYELSAPVISKDYFSIRMYASLSLLNGQNVIVDEIIVYHVVNGKIVMERFFY